MSETMQLIDEARRDRDIARQQAAQWQYVATLLFLHKHPVGDPVPSIRFPKKDRDVGRHYLVPEEMKAGALKVTLMEAPEIRKDDAAV